MTWEATSHQPPGATPRRAAPRRLDGFALGAMHRHGFLHRAVRGRRGRQLRGVAGPELRVATRAFRGGGTFAIGNGTVGGD